MVIDCWWAVRLVLDSNTGRRGKHDHVPFFHRTLPDVGRRRFYSRRPCPRERGRVMGIVHSPPRISAAAERQRRRRAKLAAAREIEFVREDWALFLDPRRLSQKAGCPRDRLRAMILKELVDNGLDAGAEVTLDRLDPDTWLVADKGRGLDRDQVVRLFAVDRPLVSTKLLHRPTRGAIGNGLRVVMGGAVASGGRLTVESRRARYALDVDRATGGTVVIEEGPSDITAGTRVTIAFGPELAGGADDGDLARLAIRCAGPAVEPMRSHPSWYGEDDFAELVHAAPAGTTLTDFAAMFGIGLEADRPVMVTDLAILKARAGRAPDLLPLGADRFPGFYAKERGKMGGRPGPGRGVGHGRALPALARPRDGDAAREPLARDGRDPYLARPDQAAVRLGVQPRPLRRSRLAGRPLRGRPGRHLAGGRGHHGRQGTRP